MNQPPPLPPSPPPFKPKSHLGIGIALVLVVGTVVSAMIFAGFKVYQKAQARRQVWANFEKSVDDERQKMAQSKKDGDVAQSDAAIGRLKTQLANSASQLGGSDAGAARAMAAYFGKMQLQLRAYSSAADKITQAKVLTWNISSRDTIATDRQMVSDFLSTNARFEDSLLHSADLLGAELDAEKVPTSTRDATLRGFAKGQALVLPLQIQIRKCDKKIGENTLAALDLLDLNWGKWGSDPATGKLQFQSSIAREAFNDHVKAINAAMQEQKKAQQELIAQQSAHQQH